MVPFNMTYLHCLQHSLFEHLFNLYFDEGVPFHQFNLTYFSCVAAVKCRPVIHVCVVISYSGPQGSWIVCCLHLKIMFRSLVWHLSLSLMNSFNKTEVAVFPRRLCFLRAFPFIRLILLSFRSKQTQVENVFPCNYSRVFDNQQTVSCEYLIMLPGVEFLLVFIYII